MKLHHRVKPTSHPPTISSCPPPPGAVRGLTSGHTQYEELSDVTEGILRLYRDRPALHQDQVQMKLCALPVADWSLYKERQCSQQQGSVQCDSDIELDLVLSDSKAIVDPSMCQHLLRHPPAALTLWPLVPYCSRH